MIITISVQFQQPEQDSRFIPVYVTHNEFFAAQAKVIKKRNPLTNFFLVTPHALSLLLSLPPLGERENSMSSV